MTIAVVQSKMILTMALIPYARRSRTLAHSIDDFDSARCVDYIIPPGLKTFVITIITIANITLTNIQARLKDIVSHGKRVD